MSLKLEVLAKPKLQLLESINQYYNYDASELEDYRKQCAVTIKQSTFQKTIDYIYERGYVERGHRVRMLTLIERVLDIFSSSGVTYWFLGEVLRDCVCFGQLLATTKYGMIGVLNTHFKQLIDHIKLIQDSDTNLAFYYADSNPSVITVQHRYAQGLNHPMLFIYSYNTERGFYQYGRYHLSSLSDVLPVVNRSLDAIKIPTPNDQSTIYYLNAKFPFWRHSLLILCLDRPVLLLLEHSVRRNAQLLQAVRQHTIEKRAFKLKGV